MKFIILCIFLFLSFLNVSAETISLDGRVVDAITKEALPGALVTIPDLKISVVSSSSGQFTFTNIPQKGRFLVEVRYIGYSTLIQIVDISAASGIEFALYPSTIEAK